MYQSKTVRTGFFALFILLFTFSTQQAYADSSPVKETIALRQTTLLHHHAQLKWSVNFDGKPSYWVVERAAPQKSFFAIARISAERELSFTDPDPQPTYRYRVKAIWRDGHQTFSNQIKWQYIPLYFPFGLTPNPAWDQVMLSFPLTKDKLQIRIYNMQGKLVMNHSVPALTTEYFFFIDELPMGTYLFEATYQGESYRTRLNRR